MDMEAAVILRLVDRLSGPAKKAADGLRKVFDDAAQRSGVTFAEAFSGKELSKAIDVAEQPSSYARQLEVFVAAVRDGSPILTGPADSVATMVAIDAMYLAAGLEPRA